MAATQTGLAWNRMWPMQVGLTEDDDTTYYTEDDDTTYILDDQDHYLGDPI